jgi:methionyl aminopeptidase
MSKISIKTKDELEIIKEGGLILSKIFSELEKQIVEGSTSIELNKYAEFLCERYKVKPAFKGYAGSFPFTICANLNEVIVHGFSNNQKFKSGDIFGLDIGIIYNGFYLDKSSTVLIGNVYPEIRHFVTKTEKSMMQGIKAAKSGNRVGDISFAMREGLVNENFQLMRDFVGHGIGKNLHEKPEIPGDGMNKGEGDLIKPGMVFAIESISVKGPNNKYFIGEDGWTVYTEKRQYLSALFEDTIIVTEDGPLIVTRGS